MLNYAYLLLFDNLTAVSEELNKLRHFTNIRGVSEETFQQTKFHKQAMQAVDRIKTFSNILNRLKLENVLKRNSKNNKYMDT